MPIPKVYRKSPPLQINFDFADILSNAGWVTMYGISDEADTKTLSRQALESTDVESRKTGTSGNVEANFDFTFDIAQKVKGKLYVTITIEAEGFGSNTAQNDTTIEIFHYDGTTETTIGTQQSIAQLNNPVDTAADQARTTLTFDVDRFFKKEDILRVEVISTVTSAHASSSAAFYHDGANRDLSLTDQHGIATNSNLIVLVPFELNL